MTKRFPALIAALLACTAASAQAALPCIPAPEAAAVVSALAPDALRAVGTACATSLPPTALVRQTDGPLLDGYQAEADRAWPLAVGAIGRLLGPDAAQFTQSTMLRPMVATLLIPLIVAKVKPKDCAAVDRIVTLLAPLPPRNAAQLAVTLLQLSRAAKPNARDPLTICPAGRR